MTNFLKNKTSKKIKIMLTIFIIVSFIVSSILIYDFINNNLPFWYILFIIPWLILSLVFRKDKTVVWDKKLEKVVKKTEITTVLIIVSIIILRNFFIPELFREFNIIFITDATLFITLWFFVWKLYFMWDKLKFIFSEVYKK